MRVRGETVKATARSFVTGFFLPRLPGRVFPATWVATELSKQLERIWHL